MTRLVYIIGGNYGYATMFKDAGWQLAKNIEDADLIQFTGGEDVTPSLYKEGRHPTTGNNPKRDEYEQGIYQQALELNIPMAGICRGGQFLNVMNGGKMWQNVDGHLGTHNAVVSGYIGNVRVSSTNHQMMRPNMEAPHIILMTAQLSKVKENVSPNGMIIRNHVSRGSNDEDVESIFYPETRCLSYQPHPEFDNVSQCRKVYFHFINNYLLDKKDFDKASHELMDNSINERTVNELLLNAA